MFRFLFIVFLFSIPPLAFATTVEQEIALLKAQLAKLEAKIDELEAEQAVAKQSPKQTEITADIALLSQEKTDDDIKLGGAARFQYSYETYDEDNKDLGGDFDFDVFRVNVDGSIGDVLLSVDYRWYQYMDVVRYAWVGYNFDESSQGRAGVTKVPFGILPYASHSYFFSSNYYLGLEDDYDLGLSYTYQDQEKRFDLAFFKNDELGGLDGYVSNRSDRYSYDIVGIRLEGEGIFDEPSLQAAETNTLNSRYAHFFQFDDVTLELGASAQFGQLELDQGLDGDQLAVALHSMMDYGPWNFKIQATTYEYDVDGLDIDKVVVGAFSFFDTISAEADSYLANISYNQAVSWGPISNLQFYNDYTLISGKATDLGNTYMNVTGIAVTAGGVFTYIDFVTAKNQPFIGGSMASEESVNHRFNINVGYYY